ncbi:hypothetical protein AA0119_g8116 [Alternaria tenuissima]|jgi:hypothetical protein|uniref:C2H2-type domain-containing protein n=1 Tax=Alternaria tenuissima TaxID=119927 RepID=A0ABY0G470_9PLEO|nr:hypothetical protein AA0119_g8116 [Alternaria tenuissima]
MSGANLREPKMAAHQPGLRRPILQLDKAAATKAKLRLPARTSDTVSHLDNYLEIPIPESPSLSKSLSESFSSGTLASTHDSITCSYCPTKFGGIHRERDYGRHGREKHKVETLEKSRHKSQSHISGIERGNVSSSESSGDLIGAAIRDNEVLIEFGNSVDNADTNEPTSSPNKLIERPLEEGVWADDSFAQFFGGGGGGGGEGQFGNPGPVATDGSQRNLKWKDGWKSTSAHKFCRRKLNYTISEDRTMHVLERRKARLIALEQPKSRVVKADQLAHEPGNGQRRRPRKRYPCPIVSCNKIFYREIHLGIHLNAHGDVKPFVSILS